MTEALPWIFALAACTALGASLVALWASFRAAFGGAVPIELSSDVDHDARLRLMEEKDALLKNLADLRFDHEAGKVGDADFERLDGKLRDRAKTVMRLLDADVEPFRAEAEKLIAGRLGAMTRDPFRQVAPEKRDDGPKESEEVTTKKEKKEVREAMLADLDAPKDPKGGDREPEEVTTKKEKKQVREALLAGTDAKAEPKDEPTPETSDETEAASGSKACPSCETDNDADAVFCKKCGHRFETNEGESAEEAE